MSRRLVPLFLMVLICTSQRVIAQSKPDFSGTWVVVRFPEFMKRYVTPDIEVHQVVQQSATILSISMRIVSKSTGAPLQQRVPAPVIFYLDGHERRSAQSDGRVRTLRTFWDGGALVTRTVVSKNGGATETSMRKLSFDRAGMLVVESILGDGTDPRQPRDIMILRRK